MLLALLDKLPFFTSEGESFTELLRSAAHWEFEIFLILLFDVLIGLVVWPYIDGHMHSEVSEEHTHVEIVEEDLRLLAERVAKLEGKDTAIFCQVGDLCSFCQHPLTDVNVGQESCDGSANNHCQCACWDVLRGRSPVIK